MTCHDIYWQKARTKNKDIGGSDRLTGGCVCQRVNTLYVQFQGSGQGDLHVCTSRDQSTVGTTCVEVQGLEETTLTIPAPCATYTNRCPPIFLTVAVMQTKTQCSGKSHRHFEEKNTEIMKHA
jgi:hypothetical protein